MMHCTLKTATGVGMYALNIDVPHDEVERFYYGESRTVTGTICRGCWNGKYTALEMDGTTYTIEKAVPQSNGTAVSVTLGEPSNTSSAKPEGA